MSRLHQAWPLSVIYRAGFEEARSRTLAVIECDMQEDAAYPDPRGPRQALEDLRFCVDLFEPFDQVKDDDEAAPW